MNASQVVFPEAGRAALESVELAAPAAGEVLVRTSRSLISPGTEGLILHQRFADDSHWAEYGQLPHRPGYSSVGVVETVGEGSRWDAGRRVVTNEPHASAVVLGDDALDPVPDGVADEEAAWFALAQIAFRGAQVARYSTGDDVLIVGAGPIGQMSVRWARVAGAREIVVVDPLASRLEHARTGGASRTIAAGLAEAGDELGDDVPGIIVDTTGNAAVFEQCLRVAPQYGRVVLLGDTGFPGEQRLAGTVISRGLEIAGAHVLHARDGWTQSRVRELFFRLVADGRFSLEGLTTHTVAPEDCQQAYEIATGDPDKALGVLIDWSAEGRSNGATPGGAA